MAMAVAAVLLGVYRPAGAAQESDARPQTNGDKTTSAGQPSDYTLESGDKLRIDVYRDEQLSQSVQIRPDGKITMPLVGDLVARGLTPLALRDRIAAALQEYVRNPVVTVMVVEATSPCVYVVGEVARPGMITMKSDLTVLQALAMAGGLKDFADMRHIRILRKRTSVIEAIPFDYRAAIRGEGTPMYLVPGDTIVVPD
jgi:polysaccharide export outer membrane protein